MIDEELPRAYAPALTQVKVKSGPNSTLEDDPFEQRFASLRLLLCGSLHTGIRLHSATLGLYSDKQLVPFA